MIGKDPNNDFGADGAIENSFRNVEMVCFECSKFHTSVRFSDEVGNI
jgi:hypothetical protein